MQDIKPNSWESFALNHIEELWQEEAMLEARREDAYQKYVKWCKRNSDELPLSFDDWSESSD
jgi:hypothetical protein